MSFEVPLISDVTKSLKKFLEEIPALTVILDLPNESTSGSGVSLILYSTSENQYLKNQESIVKTSDQLMLPPVVLDLFYLIVPYSSAPKPEDARLNEQMILGAVIRTLYDNPVLNGLQLEDSLIGSGNTELKVIPNELSLEQLNNLWSMFRHSSYRVCLSYLVTPLKIPSFKILDISRVVSKQIDFVNKEGD